MKTPDTAPALQRTARRAWDILVRNTADGTRVDQRYVAWEEALEHFAEGRAPATAEHAEIAEFLELLEASSIADPMDDECDGAYDWAEVDLGEETRAPVSLADGYWLRHQAAVVASFGRSTEHASAYLDHSSSEVLSRLAPPSQPEAVRSRGLVMATAGSGKTMSFTALTAKAMDMGYRLVIVLSGSRNIQRLQIQQALDAHLVEGGNDPILRLTTTEHDYLGTDLDRRLWEFERADPELPLNSVYNLRHTAPRLLAVKRNATVLGRLVRDLADHRAGLSDVPALVIDDESDPWSAVNTIRPGRPRPVVNELLARLLELLPRSQYVKYAWTPFSRSLIDPAGDGVLFPMDYVVTLPRPDGYLGAVEVSDGNVNVVRPWRDRGNSWDANGSLRQALDMFVLTGAVKLFRQATSRTYCYRSHTMLVQGGRRVSEQRQLVERLRLLWDEAEYSGEGSARRLNRLFDTELLRKADSYEEGSCLPETFEDLLPYIRDAAERIGGSSSPVVGMRATRHELWKVLVGGSVPPGDFEMEGLTITHLRQPSGDGAGVRWFGEWVGLHHGYRDLVRMYVQLEAGQDEDWMRASSRFESLCRAEAAFRSQMHAMAIAPGADQLRAAELPALAAYHLSRRHGQGSAGPGGTVSRWRSYRSRDPLAGSQGDSGALLPEQCIAGSAG
ncbi:Z1 domain-containing protein [Streptomyces sp. NPDC014983]|uniref:Z1 domain-containing protein n=1 Tax=Streptomyces sp. NPDC014983 TaxID=3364933 RepID=UPI0036FDC897